MNTDHDDWDVQIAYKDNPEKALFMLSSTLLQPEKLAAKIVSAISTQSPLQLAIKQQFIQLIEKDKDVGDAIYILFIEHLKKLINKIVFNKKFFLALIAGILSIFFTKYLGFFSYIAQAIK